MKFKSIAAVSVVLALAACSSNPQKPAPTAAAESDKAVAEVAAKSPAVAESSASKPRCKRVKKVGSHRTTLVCQTAEQAAAETRRTQDELRTNEATKVRVGVSPGG
jgi:hypothetical protein